MTLTLDIPTDLAPSQRVQLAHALYDARTVSAEQAAALAGVSATEFETPVLRQGSPEWKALLRQHGAARGVVLSIDATSRESIYEDDLR